MTLPDAELAHPDTTLDGSQPIDADPLVRVEALKAVVQLLTLRAAATKPSEYQPVGLGVVLGLAEHTTRWLVSGVRPPPVMPPTRRDPGT